MTFEVMPYQCLDIVMVLAEEQIEESLTITTKVSCFKTSMFKRVNQGQEENGAPGQGSNGQTLVRVRDHTQGSIESIGIPNPKYRTLVHRGKGQVQIGSLGPSAY